MIHLIVVIIAVALIVGAAAIIHSIHFYKIKRIPILRLVIIYLALYNSVTFLNFFSQYVLINISTLNSWSTFFILIILMGLAGFLITFFALYTYTRIITEMINLDRYIFFKRIYFTAFILWTVFFVIGSILFFINEEKIFLLKVHKYTNLILMALYLILTLILIIKNFNVQQAGRRKAQFYFGVLFAIFSIIDVLTLLTPLPYNNLLQTSSGLVLNVAFLFGLKPFMRLYGSDVEYAGNTNSSIDTVMTKYGISPREKEIVELIYKGMSNKEIEHHLYISSNTIKNHIYHIFKKTGVNSRVQLINLIISNKAE